MTTTKHDTIADMAIRVARAELERDLAIGRAEKAEEEARYMSRSYGDLMSGDKERILKTLHIIGIPARDLADMYAIEQEWHKAGGSQAWLDQWRQTKNGERV